MSQLRDGLHSKSLTVIEVFLMAVLLLFGYTKDIAAVEFHPDESFWIVSSVRLDKLISGDFDSALWTDDPTIVFEVRPIPSYFARIGQRLGNIPANSLPIYWNWGLSEEENTAQGAMPSGDVIWWSRLPMAVISAFSMLLTAMLLAKSHSRLASYIFTIISFNGYFLLTLRRAMSEASILLFSVLVMVASYKLLNTARNRDMKKSILWALVVGLFSGLAGQSKLTGLVCAAISVLGVILVIIPRPAQWLTILKQRQVLIIIFVITIATLGTFIASYPFYYSNTVDRIWETFYARSQIMEFQAHTYAYTLIPHGSRLGILFQRIFDYPIHIKSNNIIKTIFQWLNLIIAATGITYAIKQVWSNSLEKGPNLVLLLGTLLLSIPMLFTPFDWDRYYLYPIYFGCIFFAVGISQLTLNFKTSEKTK